MDPIGWTDISTQFCVRIQQQDIVFHHNQYDIYIYIILEKNEFEYDFHLISIVTWMADKFIWCYNFLSQMFQMFKECFVGIPHCWMRKMETNRPEFS